MSPESRIAGPLRVVLVNLVLTMLLVGLFDLVAYRLVPARRLSVLGSYGQPPSAELFSSLRPRGYFDPHEARGFDIGAHRRGEHAVDGLPYLVWSNSIGCFDREPADFGSSVYFAGDSFTWGYAPFETKFATLIEKESGTSILKCGVDHTGQRHQLAKLVEMTQRTASVPRRLVVFFYENDVANDYAHPHSTVKEGWLIDSVQLDERNQLVRLSDRELSDRLLATAGLEAERRERPGSAPASRGGDLKDALLRHSLTANLLRISGSALRNRLLRASNRATPPALHNLYLIPAPVYGRYPYLENPYARQNQAALLAFDEWSRRHGVPFAVVLIPRKRGAFDPGRYEELREFLSRNRIRYLDLTLSFHARGFDPSDLYWRHNSHFNVAGNREVANAVLRELADFFPRADPE